jgi:rubredoxin
VSACPITQKRIPEIALLRTSANTYLEAPTHFDGASVTSSARDGSSNSTGSPHAEIAPRFPDPVILIPARTPFKKWICELCGWIYDEEAGAPEDGIPPGTRWADVPGDWRCPLCGAGKDDFEMVEFETLVLTTAMVE